MVIEINMEKILVAHNGSFHADDIFACATILASFPKENIKIVRTRDEEIIKNADFVVDVGGIHDESIERFDHHQKGGAGIRENGIPYASFGLVWQKYGEKLCGSREVADEVDKQLVQAIDAPDNGVELYKTTREDALPFDFHNLYSLFLPSWKEVIDVDAEFVKLVSYARVVLDRIIKKTKDLIEAQELVRDIYKNTSDKRIVELPQYLPWKKVLTEYEDSLIVVYPRQDKSWGTEMVPAAFRQFESRIYFPVEWAGLVNEELEKVTGVEGAMFCHNKRFFCVAKTKDGALALAQLALEANKM